MCEFIVQLSMLLLVIDGAQSRRKSIDHTTSSQGVTTIPSSSVEEGGGVSATGEGGVRHQV